MTERSLISHSDLDVRLSDTANEGIMEILEHAVQGSEGGLRFQLRNVRDKIAAYGDQIRFISLYKKNHITGTVGSCYRVTGHGNLRYPSSYIRYLAFQSTYRTEHPKRFGDKPVIRQEKDDTFKQKTLEIFSKPQLLGYKNVGENDKHIMYALLESMNERSKNLVNQAGYEYIRSFLTVAFSRFSPRTDPRVSRISSSGDKEIMKSLLIDHYRDHSFFNTDYIFYGDRYYVLKEGNEVVAGVCAIPSSYQIYECPGYGAG